MDTVVLPQNTFEALTKLIVDEIKRLRKELDIVEEEIKILESKYRISSDAFKNMIKGKIKWRLPENSELDIVEWEALLEQRRRLRKKLAELEELWRQLQGYGKS